MKITVTRLRFRIAEMVLFPAMLVLLDWTTHLLEGKPLMTEYLAGAVIATVLLRGIDVMRAAAKQWPEL